MKYQIKTYFALVVSGHADSFAFISSHFEISASEISGAPKYNIEVNVILAVVLKLNDSNMSLQRHFPLLVWVIYRPFKQVLLKRLSSPKNAVSTSNKAPFTSIVSG